jgi:hypothetical protein
LTRRDTPDQLDETFTPLAAAPHACMTPLPLQTAHYDGLELPEDLSQQLWDDWWMRDEPYVGPAGGGKGWSCHHIGGWPTPIQDDMQTECALVSAGHDCGGSEALQDSALLPIRASATDWLLLAQIGTDKKGGMSWGDSGQLYLWIRREDLKARRFENAWLILQCY